MSTGQPAGGKVVLLADEAAVRGFLAAFVRLLRSTVVIPGEDEDFEDPTGASNLAPEAAQEPLTGP